VDRAAAARSGEARAAAPASWAITTRFTWNDHFRLKDGERRPGARKRAESAHFGPKIAVWRASPLLTRVAGVLRLQGVEVNTLNLERILAVVDFSSHGDVVLAQALALAKWHDAALDVLHLPGRLRLGRDTTAASAHATLVDFVARANPGRVATSAFVVEGRAVPSIIGHVRKRRSDLIVMGQSGWRPWPRRRLAATVTRRARRPVITVPRGASIDSVQTNFRRIVCAVDESIAARAALRTALHLAQESGGEVTVLHVVEGFPHDTVYSAASVPRLLEAFDRRAARIVRRLRTLVPPEALHWCDVDYRVIPGLASHTIATVASSQGADLVVVGGSPRSWPDLTPSTVAGVLARATCPVLTVPGRPGRAPGVEARPAIVDLEGFDVAQRAPVAAMSERGREVLWSS